MQCLLAVISSLVPVLGAGVSCTRYGSHEGINPLLRLPPEHHHSQNSSSRHLPLSFKFFFILSSILPSFAQVGPF